MKKMLFFVFLLFMCISCKQGPEGIHGQWSRQEKAQVNEGYFVHSLNFDNNGIYQNIVENGNSVWSQEVGKYYYVGIEEGTLYLFDRKKDGFNSTDTIVCKFRIDNNRLYVFYNAGCLMYTR